MAIDHLYNIVVVFCCKRKRQNNMYSKFYRNTEYRRYHKDVYFPDNYIDMLLDFFNNLNFVHLTTHSIEKIRNNHDGIIPIPSIKQLTSSDSYLIEFYSPITNGEVQQFIQKLLIRVRNLSDKLDYSYIIAREGFIVSAWSNNKHDFHILKNNQNYYRPK